MIQRALSCILPLCPCIPKAFAEQVIQVSKKISTEKLGGLRL
jgi:hypothetical protein